MAPLPPLPEIPESERTEWVVLLLEYIRAQAEQLAAQAEQLAAQAEQLAAQAEQQHLQKEENQALKDEIARLKGLKGKPDIKPSRLSKPSDDKKRKKRGGGKRAGSKKRRKTKELTIHETRVLAPCDVPQGSRFKGYQDYVVQELVIRTHNVRYRIERWVTPEGETLRGELPGEVIGHFGAQLVSFILYQYYHCHVTQPLIWEQLCEFGVDISKGQINRIITEGKQKFHAEKQAILTAGLEVSSYIHTDDTGARHQGKSAVATHIGNELFAYFETTHSKSRINFLECLHAGEPRYVLNEDAMAYIRNAPNQDLMSSLLKKLAAHHGVCIDSREQFQETLQEWGIKHHLRVRAVTEGALLASLLEGLIRPDLAVMSDGAGQFNVLMHVLCWVHAERTLAKLVGFNDEQRQALEQTRDAIWALYKDLRAYKAAPCEQDNERLGARFDEIFTQKTCFATLNKALARLYKRKDELLRCLERPELPLHNNPSENDIRDYVKKRKISASTRSEAGRKGRDTFASLKKTSRKLGVSFWCFLLDRVAGTHHIPALPELIRARASPA